MKAGHRILVVFGSIFLVTLLTYASMTLAGGTLGSQSPYLFIEEFDSAAGWTSTHPEQVYVDEANSRAVINASRSEVRLLWRTIPDLTSGDFRLTVKGQFNTANNNCSVDIRLTDGLPAPGEQRAEVLVRYYYYGGGCPNPINHIMSWWTYPNGEHYTTFQGYECGGSNGTSFPSAGVCHTRRSWRCSAARGLRVCRSSMLPAIWWGV